jgi:hypothetical protein
MALKVAHEFPVGLMWIKPSQGERAALNGCHCTTTSSDDASGIGGEKWQVSCPNQRAWTMCLVPDSLSVAGVPEITPPD